MRRPDLAGVRRLRRAAIRSVAVAVSLAVFPAAAQAATTWNVNTTSDPAGPGCVGTGPCSIRQALQAAGPGDTISIPASSDHYTVARGPLPVATPNLTLAGAGAQPTVVDAAGSSRVFDVDPGAGTTVISGLTVTGGSVSGPGPMAGGAGIYLHTGSLALGGVTVSGNSVQVNPAESGNGGAGILDASTGSLTLMLSSVTANTAKLTGGGPGGGAGILDLSGPLTLSGASIDRQLAVGVGSVRRDRRRRGHLRVGRHPGQRSQAPRSRRTTPRSRPAADPTVARGSTTPPGRAPT